MGRNRYLQIGYLATHPAFSPARVALVCPVCKAEYMRVREYDADFLGHDPDARLAWKWLSGKKYGREAPKRGWPSFDQALTQFGG